jgi:hypothetical protein
VCDIDGDYQSFEQIIACPRCPNHQMNYTKPQTVLAHAGSHILYDSKLPSSSKTCGLCLSNACIWYLKTRKKVDAAPRIDTKKTTCPNYANFSYKCAASSTETSPCSNVPVLCPRCPAGSPAIWSYNMEAHHEGEHPHAPSGTVDQYKLTAFETAKMKLLWKKRSILPQVRRKNAGALIISDAHRACMVLRCVICSL